MRWNAFLRAAVLVAALLCLCPRGAAAAEAAQKLELTKGLNFVALPAAPLSADLTDVLRPILDQVEMVQFYEPKTGSWRFFAPALNGDNTLADLREGAAFYVRVRDACTLALLTAVSTDAAQKPTVSATPPAPGWNPYGVLQAATPRDLVTAVPDRQFSLSDDALFSAVNIETATFQKIVDADAPLAAGQGLWLYNVVPPGSGAGREVADGGQADGKDRDTGGGQGAAGTGAGGTQAAAGPGLTATAKPPALGSGKKDTAKFGDFTFSVDPESKKATFTAVPDDLQHLFVPDKDYEVRIVYEDGIAAAAQCMVSLDNADAALTAAGMALKKKDVSYGVIAEDEDSGKVRLELGAEVTVDGKKLHGEFFWKEGQGKELRLKVASRGTSVVAAWTDNNGAVERKGGDRSWCLPLPDGAPGVFDMEQDSKSIDSLDEGDHWVPLTLDTGGGISFTSKADVNVSFLQALFPGGGGELKKTAQVTVDADGEVAAGDDRIFREAALVCAPGGAFQAVFRGWHLVPEIHIADNNAVQRNSLVWNPELTLQLADKGDNWSVAGGLKLDAELVASLCQQTGGTSMTDYLKALVQRAKEAFARQTGANPPTPGRLPAGSSLTLSPFFAAQVGTEGDIGGGEKKEFTLDTTIEADFQVAGLAGSPGYAHWNECNLDFQIDFWKDVVADVFVSRIWSYNSDSFFAGVPTDFEDKFVTRATIGLDFAQACGWDGATALLSLDWRTDQTFDRTGDFQRDDGIFIPNANIYKYQSSLLGSFDLADASDSQFAANGWRFGVKNVMLTSAEREIGFRADDNAFMSLLGTPFSRRPLTDIQQINGEVILIPPDDLEWFPTVNAYLFFDKVTVRGQDKWTKVFLGEVEFGHDFDGGTSLHIHTVLFRQDPETQGWTFMLAGSVDFGHGAIGALFMLEREQATNEWLLYVSLTGDIDGYATVSAFAVIRKEDGEWQWKKGTYSGTARIGPETLDWLREILGDEHLDLDTGVSFTYSNGKYIFELDDLPMDFKKNLPGFFQNVKLGKILFVYDRSTKKKTLEIELDVKMDYFVDNTPEGEPEPWVKVDVTVSGGAGNPTEWHMEFDDIGPFGKPPGVGFTITSLGGGKLATGWELKGGISFRLPEEWHNQDVIKLPDTVTGTIDYKKNRGFRAEIDWKDAPKLDLGGNSSINCTGFVITKSSPWGFAVAGELAFLGNTVDGNLGIQNGGLVFTLPPGMSFHATLGGCEVEFKNFSIQFANTPALGADVTLEFSESSPLCRFFPQPVSLQLAGGPDRFTLAANLDLRATLDLGLLGEGGLGLDRLSVTGGTQGVGFEVDGDITLNSVTVGIDMGIRQENFFFVADFGDKGVSVDVAYLFAFEIKHKLGIESLLGVQYILIDDMAMALGNDIYGTSMATKKFKYVLPDAIPPVGFPFFDDFDGAVHMMGFGVNIGVQFPFPNENDLKDLVKVMVGVFKDHSLDENAVNDLHAPKLDLHDIALLFPKVPGVTFKNGRFVTTDDEFKAIFGSDKLVLIDDLQLFGPSQIVDLAKAGSVYDVVVALVPPTIRKGKCDLNLRGFNAHGAYDFHQADMNKYNQNIDGLPALDTFVKKVRYVDSHSEKEPATLSVNRGCKLLQAWGGSAPELTHTTGQQQSDSCALAKQRDFLHTLVASPDFMSLNLNNRAFATALVNAVLARAPRTGEFPTYRDDQLWVINPFDSRLKSVYTPSGTVNAAEDALLAGLLDRKISRGTALDFLIASDTFRNDVQPTLATAAKPALAAFVTGAYRALLGNAPDPEVAAAWTNALMAAAPWGTADADAPGILAESPAVALPQGYFKAAFDVKVADNTVQDEILTVKLLQGGKVLADQGYKGTDFVTAGEYQSLFLPFALSEGAGQLQVAIETTRAAQVAIEDIDLFSAVQAEVEDVALPEDLGGGTAQVRWNVVDITQEIQQVVDFLTFLTPPAKQDSKQYLPTLWKALVAAGGAPRFTGNRTCFDYSAAITVEVDLLEDAGENAISELMYDGDTLLARYGTVTLFSEASMKGKTLTLTTNLPTLTDTVLGDNGVASVKVDGMGKALLFAEANYYGARTEASSDLQDLNDTDVGPNQTSSVQIFYPLALGDVLKWRLTARTVNGTLIACDAGGVDIVFPGVPQDMHALTMLPGGRLRTAYTEISDVLNMMKPQTIFSKPDQFLADYWREVLLPLRETVTASGNSLDFTDPATGIVHSLQITKSGDSTVSAIGFDKDATDGRNLTLLRGTATFYENGSFQGTAAPVLADIGDTSLSQFANYGPYSYKLEGAAQLVFYPEPHFGKFPDAPDQTWGANQFTDPAPAPDAGSQPALPIAAPAAKTIQQLDLDAGYYQLEIVGALARTARPDEDKAIARFDLSDIDLVVYEDDAEAPVIELDLKAIKADGKGYAADVLLRAFGRNQFDNGKPTSLKVKFNVMEKTSLKVLLKGLSTLYTVNVASLALYKFQPGAGGVTATASQPYFGDCRDYGSVRALVPVAISEATEWVLTKRLPTGNNIAVAHGAIATGDDASGGSNITQGDTRIACSLRGSDNQLLLKESTDGGGGAFYLEPRAVSGYVFPVDNYYIYTGDTPQAETDLLNVARLFHTFISKQVMVTEGQTQTTATLTANSGISAVYGTHTVSAVNPSSKLSWVTTRTVANKTVQFTLMPGSDFNSGVITSDTPHTTVPTFENSTHQKAGIAIPIPPTEKNGFYFDIDVAVGESNVVKIQTSLSGRIQADGNFFFDGKGNLIIDNYTLADAEISLGSREGLSIRGKLDLFGAANILVDGYVKPDGQFYLHGEAQIMSNGTGVKGTLTFSNKELFVEGALYIANYDIGSETFKISDGTVSLSKDVGIGIGGFDYTLEVWLKSPHGAKVDGRAYITIRVPVKIWGPTSYKHIRIWVPFHHKTISIPWHWGWVTIAHVNLHFDIHVGMTVKGQEIDFNIGIATMGYNFRTHHLTAHW
ncbi:MAG: hypothetical protein A3K19_07000 [Lentisphaerae bacterium RIFOXYB12_FULL_65_16]|nr:MAG: hypothetical protein A3K19_07000 [Lentisphaerae bacterium RIFOXYB12_FULL_65_16]